MSSRVHGRAGGGPAMRAPERAALLDTPLGHIGLVWGPRGLRRVVLPSRDGAATSRVASVRDGPADARVAGVPAGPLEGVGAAWADRIVRLLSGEAVETDDLPLDREGLSDFARRVHAAACAIPRGTTVTYGELARRVASDAGDLGDAGPAPAAGAARAARAVGAALGGNPTPIVVPCHRVVAAHGPGGFSAPLGLSTKAQLLALEGGSLDDAAHERSRRHLARVEPSLAPLVRALPCTLPVAGSGNLFRTLVRAIAGQQLSTRAGAMIFARLEAALTVDGDAGWTGARWPADAPARVLALDEAALRAVGLSGAKVASVRDLARRVDSGALALERVARLPDEAIVDALTEVRGVGRWTVEMLLIFELGRPDVLPVGDLGVRKGFRRVRGLSELPDAAALVEQTEAWRPYRSVGAWYLWRALSPADAAAPGEGP